VNILFLRPQPGIRSLKYALAFKNVGFDVDIIHGYVCKTLTDYYGYGDEYFEKFVKLDLEKLEEDIKNVVNRYHIDLIHSHNAPDYLTVAAIRAVDDVPIIHENQDVISMRKTPFSPGSFPGSDRKSLLLNERIANEQCDARIHVTKELFEYVREKYGSKREIVLCNYMSESMMPTFYMEKLSNEDGNVHIVYEGSLSSFDDDHYDLAEIFENIASNQIHIHIYAANTNLKYKHLAEKDDFIHYHGHLDPRKLFEDITQYDFGWAGFNDKKNKPHMDVALPNKTMEYIACGLPTLSFPHKAQKRFIKKHGVGIVIDDLKTLPQKLSKNDLLKEVQENVWRKRLNFTFEKNIDEVIRLYKTLV
jgi:glycosyltransferase involved in cell wall biosynthesis